MIGNFVSYPHAPGGTCKDSNKSACDSNIAALRLVPEGTLFWNKSSLSKPTVSLVLGGSLEGKDAVKVGLINEVGGLHDAMEKLHELICISEEKTEKIYDDSLWQK